MAELGQTSSMTSVTEEDTSADSESDTTESSYSNITSSVLSSTDTDDKLTPGLVNISLSNSVRTAGSPSKERKQLNDSSTNKVVLGRENSINSDNGAVTDGVYETSKVAVTELPSSDKHTKYVYPYGSNPLPLDYAEYTEEGKGSQSKLQMDMVQTCKRNVLSRFKENMGVDDDDNKLSTDLSDTSSIPAGGNRSNNNDVDLESNEEEGRSLNTDEEESKRPLYPDFASGSWYQAKCFDRYWSHYNFVMEWYQEHVRAVRTLQGQMSAPWGYAGQNRFPRSESSKRRKRSRRARSRRSAKARQRGEKEMESSFSIVSDSFDTCSTSTTFSKESNNGVNNQEDGEDEELEMEITDEMLEFFTASFKHRMERDNAKNGLDGLEETSRQNIEEAKAGQQGPSTEAPSERPGVRRTKEMRQLYGAGAPMIHGMETALQMTFDRITDRFQPKLWPNMPLKIIFE